MATSDGARIIRWERWSDPIAAHINRRYEDDNGNLMVFKDDTLDGIDIDNPCVLTRAGIVPYHESNSPGKLFKFWIGHTNFDMGPDMARRIEAEAGVEALDVYTRYRFRIAIGKLFNDDAVKKAIEVSVNVRDKSEGDGGLKKLIRLMRSCTSPWAIAVFPDGQLRILRGTTEEIHHVSRLLEQHGARIITAESAS